MEQHGLQELLNILNREFEYYKGAYQAVGTQAALIAGFTVSVLVTLDTTKQTDARVEGPRAGSSPCANK